MSHMDDGMLHTYLDGEMPAEEVARFEEHLATCADCRGRLDLARQMRTRAHEILRYADPPAIVAPDFAVLASRRPATGASTARARVRPFLLPWAASVVLALGAGWFAQTLLRGAGSGADRVATAERELAPPRAAPAPVADVGSAEVARGFGTAAGTSGAAETVEAGDRGEEPGVATLPPSAGIRDAGERSAVQMEAIAVAAGEDEDAVAEPQEVPTAAAVQPELAVARESVVAGRQADAPATLRATERREAQARALPTAPRETAAITGAAAPPSPLVPLPGPTDSDGWPLAWVSVSREAAAAALGAEPVVVAGPSVEEYQVGDGVEGAVRVLQRLPGGERLEVLQRRAPEEGVAIRDGDAAQSHAAAAEGATVRGQFEFRIRADVAQDSLRRLLEGLR